MSLYYNSLQNDLARKDWVLVSLQILAAICTPVLWSYDLDLVSKWRMVNHIQRRKGYTNLPKLRERLRYHWSFGDRIDNMAGFLTSVRMLWLIRPSPRFPG